MSTVSFYDQPCLFWKFWPMVSFWPILVWLGKVLGLQLVSCMPLSSTQTSSLILWLKSCKITQFSRPLWFLLSVSLKSLIEENMNQSKKIKTWKSKKARSNSEMLVFLMTVKEIFWNIFLSRSSKVKQLLLLDPLDRVNHPSSTSFCAFMSLKEDKFWLTDTI